MGFGKNGLSLCDLLPITPSGPATLFIEPTIYDQVGGFEAHNADPESDTQAMSQLETESRHGG